MHFDSLDLVEEIIKVVNNPYITYETPDLELQKALKNILDREKEFLYKENPLSEESIELFREELQKHAFEGENNFSIKQDNLFSMINHKELDSFLKWCKENDIEVTTNISENNGIIYTFAWDN